MTRIFVTRRSGEEVEIDGLVDGSLMAAMRDNGVEEVLALCGGCCSCSTCHVWVDRDYVDRLAAPSKAESDLLGLSQHKRSNSRLSCQISLSPGLDGIRVSLPPED